LLVFASASVLALWLAMDGLALICCCLILYLRPEAPLHECAEPAPSYRAQRKTKLFG
jgi:hypothetical protein